MKNKTLTVMFADVQGYTLRSVQESREETELFTSEIRVIVQNCVEKRGGNLVKTMGDGFLVTFESPTDAVLCGMEIQKGIEQRNALISDKRKKAYLRIGINTGEVNIDPEGDIYGKAVNIASKIQQSARPNKVFISETTYMAMNETEIRNLRLEAIKSKGILKKVKIYGILRELEENKIMAGPEPFKKRGPDPSNNLRILLLGIIIILLIIVASGKSGKAPLVGTITKKYNAYPCKIEGILRSGANPSVMISRNMYFSGGYVCGAKIKQIYQDRIIVDVRGKEKTYRIGEVIESAF